MLLSNFGQKIFLGGVIDSVSKDALLWFPSTNAKWQIAVKRLAVCAVTHFERHFATNGKPK